jgi:glycosyltransferase involved in cell wall biosynthesis
MKWWDGPKNKVENNINLHAVCKHKPLWKGEKRSIWQALSFAARLFIPLLKSNEDIIDCDQYPHFPCYISKLVSILKGKPLVITWHEVWGKYWNEYLGIFGYFGRIFESLTAKLTKFTLANSESTKLKLEKLTNHPAKLITPGTALQKSAGNKKGVVFVGRISKEKNLDMFVKIARILKHKNIKCSVIGTGPDENRIKKLAKSYGVKIDFKGDVSDKILFEQMKKNKIFLSTSTREGFSIAVLEAMGSGIPAVVVNHPNNAAVEFVPKELVVDFDENSIADRILDFDARNYKKTSEHVRKIAAHYSWDHAVRIYQRFIHDIVFHHLNK